MTNYECNRKYNIQHDCATSVMRKLCVKIPGDVKDLFLGYTNLRFAIWQGVNPDFETRQKEGYFVGGIDIYLIAPNEARGKLPNYIRVASIDGFVSHHQGHFSLEVRRLAEDTDRLTEILMKAKGYSTSR